MSMHTPGPWHWDSDPIKNDPLGRVRFRVTATGRTITQVYYSGFDGARSNAEYDSQLIAAAPELLAALEAAEAFICGATNDKPLKMIRAAIAKASPEIRSQRG